MLQHRVSKRSSRAGAVRVFLLLGSAACEPRDGLSCWADDVEQERRREVDGGRWQRMSPWATSGGLLIRLRMPSFVFAPSVLTGASALAALSMTSLAFFALSCLIRFNVLAVPYGVFPNVVSPFV